MSRSTVGKGRRRGGVAITDSDVKSSCYNSWESVGEVTDEIRRRNKGRSEEDKLSTTGTKSDMIRTLLVDDGKGIRSGGNSGKPSARGLQKRAGHGAGSSGSKGTAKPPTATEEGSDKENVGPSGRTTRSRSKTVSGMATTKAKTANGAKKTDTSDKAARAGDVILVSRGDGKEETAEVLEKDPRTGVANLWYEDAKKEETAVKLSDLAYTIKERYTEPVPQNQDLPSFDDVAPGAPQFEPDDHLALLMRMSASRSLQGVSYDENLLN